MKKILLSLLLLTTVLTVSAAERSASKMRQAAVKTLNRSKAKVTLSRPTLDVYTDGTRFAIVSRDDRFPEVLAYGVGNFDTDNLPSNVKWWFDAVQLSMEKAVKQNAPRRVAKTYEPIEPLMKTKWGQSKPYNNYCPIFEEDNTKAPTGCVATAMAQIINYQQYPASAKFVGSYIIEDVEKTAEVESTYSYPYLLAYGSYLPTADGEWEDMSYSHLQGNKVAKLLRDCGYAVAMNYSAGLSGAYTSDAAPAFISKFGYPENAVKSFYRYYYNDEEWLDQIYAELQKNSPVLYAGSDSKGDGGHAFVFHGMDAEGLPYVNWGWQGQCDGYYAIDILTPDEESDFSFFQEMVTGIRSTALSTDVIQSVWTTDKPYAFSYDEATNELSLVTKDYVINTIERDFVGRLCVIVENTENEELSIYVDILDKGEVVPKYYGLSADTYPILKEKLEPGTYRIYMASLEEGEAEWQFIRTAGGAIYYDLTVDAESKVTVADAPKYVSVPIVPTAIREIRQTATNSTASAATRFFDLQGREVSGSTKGLLIRKQGDETKKVMVK